jgi:hypothetical protein
MQASAPVAAGEGIVRGGSMDGGGAQTQAGLGSSRGSRIAVERWITLGLRIAAPLAIAAAYAWRIAAFDPSIRFFDDFFYYLKAADNWIHGAGSTWFPGEPTNGYHPLWFLWVAALLKLTGGAGASFFALVDISIAALLVGFFLLFDRFLRRMTGDPLAAAVGASFAALTMSAAAATGVEMALTCCLAAALLVQLTRKPLAEQGVRDAALAGLLGALLVLARLDAVMLAPGLAVVVLAARWDVRRLAAAAAGAAPLYAYLAFNVLAYGHAATTSMAAKSLRHYLVPNLHAMPLFLAMSSLAASAMVILLARRLDGRDARHIALALVSAPLLQLAAQVFLSGWMIFEWYFYYGVMVLGLAVALFVAELRRLALMKWAAPAGLAVLALAPNGFIGAMRPKLTQESIDRLTSGLQTFAATHPGVYAMGDAAGLPGWRLKQPIVHLEGLMMSHAFLDRIRNERPLAETFRDYHVSYYVSVRRGRPTGEKGCLAYDEPNSTQASPRAPQMRMTICVPPVETMAPGAGYDVQIYRIDPATGEAVAP